VFSRRVLTTWLLVLGAALALGPVAALATGPSAGDNQYTDPLGGTAPAKTTKTTTTAPPQQTTTSSSAPATVPSSTPTLITGPAVTSSTDPTATTATTKTGKSHTLPNTGYDGWLGGLLGAGLVAIGFGVRRRSVAGS
jgi:LPXTG-motif cell wall-anchored protein